ncbi:MAG: serine hydrolase [Planctomycetota bacterium]
MKLLLPALLCSTSVAIATELDRQLDRLAQPYVDSETVVGMTLGVVRGDDRVVRGYGRFSEDDSRVPDGETIYEIGSVSKVFTGLLLADAVIESRVSLVTPVEDLLPKGVKMKRRHESFPIRLWHLSTHTSGLPRLPGNMSPKDATNPYADYGGRQLAAFLKEFQPRKRPGEEMAYSNLGVGLLGEVLSRERKLSYDELLQQRIAEPLGMADTRIELNDDQRKRFAPPHYKGGTPGANWDLNKLAGAGAIRSTADDLLTFATANLAPRDTSLRHAIELAWMVHQKPIEDSDFAMGLGWHVARDGSTRWHNGETGGYHAALFVNRPAKAAVVVLANTATSEVDTLAQQVIQMLGGQKVKPRSFEPAEESVEVSAEAMKRLVGKYALAPTFVFDVRVKGDRLMVGVTNQPTFEVFPRSETEWFYKAVKATLRFDVDASGVCNAVELDQNGIRQTAKRVE